MEYSGLEIMSSNALKCVGFNFGVVDEKRVSASYGHATCGAWNASIFLAMCLEEHISIILSISELSAVELFVGVFS